MEAEQLEGREEAVRISLGPEPFVPSVSLQGAAETFYTAHEPPAPIFLKPCADNRAAGVTVLWSLLPPFPPGVLLSRGALPGVPSASAAGACR